MYLIHMMIVYDCIEREHSEYAELFECVYTTKSQNMSELYCLAWCALNAFATSDKLQ